MPRSFKLPAISVKDPRVVMRVIVGLLLAANLVAAVMAFKPFGGGADDLRRQQQALSAQLASLQEHLKTSRKLVEKVQTARSAGDEFLGEYFIDAPVSSATMLAELTKCAESAGIKIRQTSYSPQPLEGSDTLEELAIQVGLEGSYANLTKFVNLIDKSPRFLIIDSMTASAPQQQQQGPAQSGQTLNVTLKIVSFLKENPGAAS